MTTYTAIPNGDIDPDSPITASLMALMRDNPIAITEGASGAPRIAYAGLAATVKPWILIQSQTASGDASIDFTTGIDDSYDLHAVIIRGLQPATSSFLECQIGDSGGFETGATYEYHNNDSDSDAATYSGSPSNSADHWRLGLLSNSSTHSYGAIVYFPGLADSAIYASMRSMGVIAEAQVRFADTVGIQRQAAVEARDRIRFQMASGNIDAGELSLYGIPK